MNAKTMSDGNRIVNAIQRLLDDLEVIQYIPLFQSHIPPEDFQAFPDSVQQTITQMFEMEQGLRERMRPSSAKVNDFTEYRESVKVKVREVVDAIHEHKLIGKLRKDQPTVPDDSIFLEVIYMNTGTEKLPTSIDSSHHQASNIVWFRKVMKELKLLWEEKLETTVEEDQIRADLKDEVTAREKKANADLKALQRELSTEQNIREKEVSLREESLNKVSDELSKLRSVTSAQRKEFESFIEEKDSIAMGQYTKVTEKLDQIMNQKKQDLQTKETEHASQERQRLTDKKGLEDAIDRIIVGFEEKTRTAQTEIARLEVRGTHPIHSSFGVIDFFRLTALPSPPTHTHTERSFRD